MERGEMIEEWVELTGEGTPFAGAVLMLRFRKIEKGQDHAFCGAGVVGGLSANLRRAVAEH